MKLVATLKVAEADAGTARSRASLVGPKLMGIPVTVRVAWKTKLNRYSFPPIKPPVTLASATAMARPPTVASRLRKAPSNSSVVGVASLAK